MANSGNQWSGKSRGGRFGYKFFVYTIRLLGLRCAYFFLAFIVIYFIPFAPKATKTIWQYNRKRRGLSRWHSMVELYRHYFVFGQTLIDKLAMQGGLGERFNYKFSNYDRFLEILNSDQGVVMMGAHLGSWEAGAGFFGTYGKKINIVKVDDEHEEIKEVLNKNEEKDKNYKIIPINRDVIQAMVEMKIALDNGEYVCFNGDRFVQDSNAREAEFLGAPALFPIGPFKIAAKCRVPVVFYYSIRETNFTYRFIFEEPKIEGKITTEELMEEYVKSLERIVKKYPRQWFNFYDFWKIS